MTASLKAKEIRDREAETYARELTKDRTFFDGNDERIALVAFRAAWNTALAKDPRVLCLRAAAGTLLAEHDSDKIDESARAMCRIRLNEALAAFEGGGGNGKD